jgi:hypothetical protein
MPKAKGKATQAGKKTAQLTSKLTPQDVDNILSAPWPDAADGRALVKEAKLRLRAVGKKISEQRKNPDPRLFGRD